jgi:hypothetical protein
VLELWDDSPPNEEDRVIRVFVAQHPTEAHLLKGLLESQGIPSEIRGEALFGSRGEIPFMEALPEIWVLNDGQAAEAVEFLRARRADPTLVVDPAQFWRCSKCGESVEPQFTECWQCGAVRSDPS